MLGEPARCATHKTVLTSGGTCLLCMRRIGDPAAASTSRNLLPWVTGLVVGGLVVLAVVFKIHLSVSDRHPAQAATADPMTTAKVAPLPTTVATSSTIPGTDHASLVAEAEREVVIDFYGAPWCPACRKARSWLDAHGKSYANHDVDSPSSKRGLRELNPGGGIPTIKIDDQVIVGFNGASMQGAIRRSAEARVAQRGR